jgi:hypothetical protein
MSSDVAVVIPVAATHAGLLDWQLAALREQQYAPAFDVILVDHHRILAGVKQDCLIVDGGACRTPGQLRNLGVTRTGADYILFCDADDIVSPIWVKSMLDGLASHNLVGGGFTRTATRPPLQDVHQWIGEATPPDRLRGHEGIQFASGGNLGVRRSLFDRVGGFDPRFVRGEDVAFSLASRQIGHLARYVREALVLNVVGHSATQPFRASYQSGVARRRLTIVYGVSTNPWREVSKPFAKTAAALLPGRLVVSERGSRKNLGPYWGRAIGYTAEMLRQRLHRPIRS